MAITYDIPTCTYNINNPIDTIFQGISTFRFRCYDPQTQIEFINGFHENGHLFVSELNSFSLLDGTSAILGYNEDTCRLVSTTYWNSDTTYNTVSNRRFSTININLKSLNNEILNNTETLFMGGISTLYNIPAYTLRQQLTNKITKSCMQFSDHSLPLSSISYTIEVKPFGIQKRYPDDQVNYPVSLFSFEPYEKNTVIICNKTIN